MAKQTTLMNMWNFKFRRTTGPSATTTDNDERGNSETFNYNNNLPKSAGFSNTNNSIPFAKPSRPPPEDVIDLVDDDNEDDDGFLAAVAEIDQLEKNVPRTESKYFAGGHSEQPSSFRKPESPLPQKNKRAMIQRTLPSTSTKFTATGSLSSYRKNDDEDTIAGFDTDAGKIWIYPTNFPKRNYQYEIIEKALYYNTLVTLPTGLGKTFIAAVVMYNFYRWYPRGKIVFMAPTKPLVAQQVEACYNVMGVPQCDVGEMNGTINPSDRRILWNEKRVLFLTPHVMVNDLQKSLVSAESIKCLVIDEAHKAIGDHAYCQVIRELTKHTMQFRVLALSATPGTDLDTVQQVLSNIMIAHMELRSEDAPEIRQYTHSREIECIAVKLPPEHNMLREKYERVIQPWLDMLTQRRVLQSTTVQNTSWMRLFNARTDFRTNRPPGMSTYEVGLVENAFATCISLFHGHKLLTNMGIRSFYNFLSDADDGDKSACLRRELNRNHDLREILDTLRSRFPVHANTSANESDLMDRSFNLSSCTQQITDIAACSHPKMVKLVEILTQHFKKHSKII